MTSNSLKNAQYEIPTAIIYTRVSSKDQVDNFSLGTQERACIDYAEKHEWKVLKVFVEEGESAKTANRTKLQEMMLYIERNKGKIGHLIIYKVDRFARKSIDHFTLKVILKKHRVRLCSATEPISPDPSGEFMETILAGMAQLDNSMRAQRTVDGMKARLSKGLWSGKAPWGYMNTTDEMGNKIISPHPERSEAIKLIFEKYSTGKYTFEELAEIVNETGVKSRYGMKISKQLVSRVIENHIYYGMVVIPKFGITVKGLHEPIITEALFERAQQIRTGTADRKLPRNKDNPTFPLRGIICEGCEGKLSGGNSRGRTKQYQYYGCIKKNCIKRRSISKQSLEEDFTELLQDLTPNEEIFNQLETAIKVAHKNELESVIQAERSIRKKISELEEQKERLFEMRFAKEINGEDFSSHNVKLSGEILALNLSLNSLTPPELGLDKVIETGLDFLKHLPENWRSLDVKDLRVLRNLLFPQNLVYTYPKIKTAQLSPIYKLKSLTDEENTRLVYF